MIKKNILLGVKKIKTFKIHSYIALILIIGFSSCERNSESDLLEEVMTPIIDNPDGMMPIQIIPSVTYDGRIKTILDSSCVECHNSISPSAGLRLDTFEFAIIPAADGRLISFMTNVNTPMPPSGNLPDSIIAEVIDWIDDGLLEK